MANEQYHASIQARTLETLTQINAAMLEFSKGMQSLSVATAKHAASAITLDDEALQASVDEIRATTLEADAAFDEISTALQVATNAVAV